MTCRNYYRISLALPFILALLCLPLLVIVDTSTITDSTIIEKLVFVFCVLSLIPILASGIPYLFLCGYFLFWIRKKNEYQIHEKVYRLPLLFIPINLVYCGIIGIFIDEIHFLLPQSEISFFFELATMVASGFVQVLFIEGFVEGLIGFIAGGSLLGIYTLGFGYYYVALALGGYSLLKRVGIIKGIDN